MTAGESFESCHVASGQDQDEISISGHIIALHDFGCGPHCGLETVQIGLAFILQLTSTIRVNPRPTLPGSRTAISALMIPEPRNRAMRLRQASGDNPT
jgi:hypothetical protein